MKQPDGAQSVHAGDRLLSCGRPLIGVELAILDAEGRLAPTGAPGEIVARGANIMRGYWRQPEATRDAFVNGEVGGWFRTGDVAYRDEDGFVYHVDRRKDMIVSGGENIYPAEVEAALLAHPAVRDAAVLPAPDEQWGQIGVAYVVTDAPVSGLREFLSARLAKYKVPARFVVVPELPRNAAGKIDRVALQAR